MYGSEILHVILSHKNNKIWGEKKFGGPPYIGANLLLFTFWELNETFRTPLGCFGKNEKCLELTEMAIKFIRKCYNFTPPPRHVCPKNSAGVVGAE